MVSGLTLLHTSPVHVPVFDALRERDHPEAVLRHLVVPDLLDRARARGPESVVPELLGLLRESGGPVLVTCSTIGAVAESLAPALGFPVLRVDRPMAAEAVRTGPRIALLATVESTFAPTGALLAEEAGGRPLSVRTHLVPGAWDRFEAGDAAGYLAAVAGAADAVTDADVIVLAQASMAAAAGLVRTRLPVLSSPAPGLAAALAEGHTG
ncbi:aspartate/glutamate racemase family protein [Streptomyces sp. NBC_00091]|uniref:aspartate/glutamate racemase family protein n=1 Tax=Streptomyces sp. NBC_00091 TaxID=2975648 RepID=UPI00224CDAFF|nr:aspartate/glutamate racemase family protein [Streptomyces sp. NBC_00091]MCX5380203.1 arylsulfatase [Streptomyces sp. NBC_00091]MCX5380930.1 arylsulfatase [Streptomyces sp. NBC_00091]MCX5381671.1 arylsulfatase [Streptomyces sp. NBC_00091]